MGISQQIGASSLIKPGVIDNTAARPASPYEGQVIFQKDTDQLLVWNGTAWVIPNQTTQNPEGLELIRTTTCTSGGTASNGVVTIGSAVSSVVVDNAFSATYDNYKVIYSNVGTSTNGEYFAIQTVTAAGGYRFGGSYTAYTGTTVVPAYNNAGNYIPIGYTASSASYLNHFSVDIFAPFAPYVPRFVSNNAGGAYSTTFNGLIADTVSLTGFTTLLSGGTLTGGTIRVYGYRNS
jgi:hypothetical protein